VLSAFAQAFRTPDLRKKLLFVLFILVLFRIGSSVPVAGVSVKNINTCLKVEGSNGVIKGVYFQVFSHKEAIIME